MFFHIRPASDARTPRKTRLGERPPGLFIDRFFTADTVPVTVERFQQRSPQHRIFCIVPIYGS